MPLLFTWGVGPTSGLVPSTRGLWDSGLELDWILRKKDPGAMLWGLWGFWGFVLASRKLLSKTHPIVDWEYSISHWYWHIATGSRAFLYSKFCWVHPHSMYFGIPEMPDTMAVRLCVIPNHVVVCWETQLLVYYMGFSMTMWSFAQHQAFTWSQLLPNRVREPEIEMKEQEV
jgi:hypothetical protein